MIIPKNLLKSLNLSNSQAAVYVAALELGQATIQSLSRKSNVPRASIYRFIDELRERQLMVETKKGARQYYSAVDPEQLVEIERMRLADLQRIVPELTAIQNRTNRKPRVRFYEGITGIKSVYTDTLSAEREIVSFSDFSQELQSIDRRFYDDFYIPERQKRNIMYRSILRDSPAAQEYLTHAARNLLETKVIPDIDISSEIDVYNNKVAIMSFRKSGPYAVLIEDEALARTLKAIWSELWKRIKE